MMIKCKNCPLFNSNNSTCQVTIIHEGEFLELKTKPNDKCHWLRVEKELGIDIMSQIQEIELPKKL